LLLYSISILPCDKNFNPALFLSLIHGSTPLNDFKRGLRNLRAAVDDRTKAREELVRNHFGLFVHCADELEWLRNFRRSFRTRMSKFNLHVTLIA
jgi:hypothetical protein